MSVEYHPEIEHELKEIIEYYNRRSQGLGTKFLDEFERQILRISSMPTQWMVVEDDIRRSLNEAIPLPYLFSSFGK